MHVTQSIFYYLGVILIATLFCILLKQTNFEAIDFNMYIMQLIGMKNS
jgi:hypothetical protein